MLKQTERLNRLDFSKFFKRGKRWHFPHLTIIYHDYPTLHASVVVSKKVAKTAVRRNKIRRRIYARLHNILKAKNKTGVFIIITKPSYDTLQRTAADELLVASIAPIIKSA